MVHPHWPHWAVQVAEDVEHQGRLHLLGFVIVVTMLIGTLMSALAATIDALVHTLG